MSKLALFLALAVGICLVYAGYEKDRSLSGRAEKAAARIDRSIDAADHTTTQMKFYIAGTVLTVVGIVGLGCSRR